jgi:quinol monooxygenase YgiN
MRAAPISSSRTRASRAEAVCVVARAEARAGAEEDLATLLTDFADEVRANEPGCTSYLVTQAMGSRECFAVHARFASWRAFNEHAETSHLTRALPRLTALLAAPISMEIFLEMPSPRGAIGADDAGREIDAERRRE